MGAKRQFVVLGSLWPTPGPATDRALNLFAERKSRWCTHVHSNFVSLAIPKHMLCRLALRPNSIRNITGSLEDVS